MNLTTRAISKLCRLRCTIKNNYWNTEVFCGFSLRREYPPLSLGNLQLFIDTNRVDPTKPIDLITVINTGLYDLNLNWRHAGIHLTDEVMLSDFCV